MLYYTVGLPRSGKSTLCDQWIKREVRIAGPNSIITDCQFIPCLTDTERNAKPRVIVCSDDIRLALHGQRYQKEAEEMVSSIKYIMIRAYLSRGFDVLVDGTHTFQHSFEKLMNIDKDAEPVFILTSVELCKERAKSTNQEDLIPVIDRMNEQLMERGIFCRE